MVESGHTMTKPGFRNNEHYNPNLSFTCGISRDNMESLM